MRGAWRLSTSSSATSSAARRLGCSYWIDFEFARIQTQPQWEAGLKLQRETLENLFDLGSDDSESGEAVEKVA